MFWDNVAPLYNFFENIYNGSVNRRLCQTVASLMDPEDRVLECAIITKEDVKHES